MLMIHFLLSMNHLGLNNYKMKTSMPSLMVVNALRKLAYALALR
jgi:hypothetical protein